MDYLDVQIEGRIFNAAEVAAALDTSFLSEKDLPALLNKAFLKWGAQMVNHLDGEFVAAVEDKRENSVYLFRDRLGVRTLYYTVLGGKLVYSTDLAKLLRCPGLKPVLDREGICELFGLGPARTPGKTPIANVQELPPGCFLRCHKNRVVMVPYWKLETKPWEGTEEEAVERGRELLLTALRKRLPKEPVAVLLSGGLDSSYLAALYAKEQASLMTYSLDFVGSQQYFVPNSFQPELDRPFVEKMAHVLNSRHKTILCDVKTQVAGLKDAMMNHGIPCMADIQTTLNYVCREVAKENHFLLTGECADEIFGGYPWFHVPEYVDYEGFPWMYDLTLRQSLLHKDVAEKVALSEYVGACYEEAIRGIEYLEGEDESSRKLRKNTYLTIYYFMQTLIRRTDVAVSAYGQRGIVPFADPDLVEFAYNLPWSLKAKNGTRKYVLRQMAQGILPEEVRNRPKSPYPKNYHPDYLKLLGVLWEEARKEECPVFALVEESVLEALLHAETRVERPWFGQLMKGPQMVAYLYMVNEWMKEFDVSVELS
ncbi:asparagine synthase (glutamine-hydrolysing) [Lachnospiraceae bacterium XBB1006]|nr:asparagine synthase (glutamine-hydrolysing) [Lachnospiraceae bacterium XBB1006]